MKCVRDVVVRHVHHDKQLHQGRTVFLYGQAITGWPIGTATLINPPESIADERWIHDVLRTFLVPGGSIVRAYENGLV